VTDRETDREREKESDMRKRALVPPPSRLSSPVCSRTRTPRRQQNHASAYMRRLFYKVFGIYAGEVWRHTAAGLAS
jgi:hypothetical protein